MRIYHFYICILIPVILFSQDIIECGTSTALQSLYNKVTAYERPELPQEQLFTTNHFVIHYTLEPGDPNQTTQQWVDYAAQHVEECWEFM